MFGTRQITGYIVFVICRSIEGRTRQLLDEIGLFCDDKVTKLHIIGKGGWWDRLVGPS